MKISFNWLKNLVKLPSEVTVKELADKLIRQVVEVDNIINRGAGLENVVAGKIVEIADHPQADRLGVASINIGQNHELTVVFGKVLPLKVGDVVAVAMAPGVLPTGVEVKAGAIRGVESSGMVCVDEELGLSLGGQELDDPKHPGEKIHLAYLPAKTKPGTSLVDIFNLNDVVLEIDNVAIIHRPDLWGHYGLAREVAALYGVALVNLKISPLPPGKGEPVAVELQTSLCRRYIGANVENITIQPSPVWLRSALEAVGVRPINNIVDITNYVMLELGQPLHAFDAASLKGNKITVREARINETLATLDEQEYKVPAGGLLICDGDQSIALAGIMGGRSSQITDKTAAIILESANFEPQTIRQSSLTLGLRTEASVRFEKGLDPALADIAMQRALTLIKQLCPGAVLAAAPTDVGELKEYPPLTLEVTTTFISDRLGIKVDPAEVVQALKPLGFIIKKGKKDSLLITVPHWRLGEDISMAEDIVEEVGRRLGYDRIVPALPLRSITKTTAAPIIGLIRRLKNLLANRYGLTEALTYSFALPSPLASFNGLVLANPPTVELNELRQLILPNLVAVVAKNIRAFKKLGFFEVGRVFRPGAGSYEVSPDSTQHLPAQPRSLGIILTDPASSQIILFRQLKGIVSQSLQHLGYPVTWSVLETKSALIDWLEADHTAVALVNGEQIGFVTILPSQHLQQLKIKQVVAAAELDLTKLAKISAKVIQYQPFNKYPSIMADISLIVDQGVRWADLENLVTKFHPLIKEVELFDVYEGSKIANHQRSLAFHITFSSPERTLTDEEVKEVMIKLTATLKEKFQAEIR